MKGSEHEDDFYSARCVGNHDIKDNSDMDEKKLLTYIVDSL